MTLIAFVTPEPSKNVTRSADFYRILAVLDNVNTGKIGFSLSFDCSFFLSFQRSLRLSGLYNRSLARQSNQYALNTDRSVAPLNSVFNGYNEQGRGHREKVINKLHLNPVF